MWLAKFQQAVPQGLKTVLCCVEDLVGTNVYKEGREKLNTRVKTSCSICNALNCKSILNLFVQNVIIAESISSRNQ